MMNRYKVKMKEKKLSKRKIKKTLKEINRIANEDIRTFRAISAFLDEKGLEFVVDSNDVIIGVTESTERLKELKEKALNYLINEQGFVVLNNEDKDTILTKDFFRAVVSDKKTIFLSKLLIRAKINHEDIENYDFIENKIVRKRRTNDEA